MKTPSRKKKFSGQNFKDKAASKSKVENPSGVEAEATFPKTRLETRPSTRVRDGTANHFPIVGIGASAGGLEAFTELLKHLPLDTGLGFVPVQHLDPQHESALTQLLTRATSLSVSEVTHGRSVAPNHVYVIPPNRNMIIARGILKLQSREKTAGAHRSIDFFFASRMKTKSRKQEAALKSAPCERVSK